MKIKPELKQAVAYNKIKATDYNSNFNTLLDYIENISEELTLEVNTINSQLSSNVLSSLQSVYPVGSLYIGTTANCPIANLFGTWEKVSSGIVTSVNSNVPIKGTGATLGLNNSGSDAVGYLNLYRSSYNEAILKGNGGTRGNVYVTKDANNSGIVGTVTSSELSVNIWKRTA